MELVLQHIIPQPDQVVFSWQLSVEYASCADVMKESPESWPVANRSATIVRRSDCTREINGHGRAHHFFLRVSCGSLALWTWRTAAVKCPDSWPHMHMHERRSTAKGIERIISICMDVQ
jgi:hypothetical protein